MWRFADILFPFHQASLRLSTIWFFLAFQSSFFIFYFFLALFPTSPLPSSPRFCNTGPVSGFDTVTRSAYCKYKTLFLALNNLGNMRLISSCYAFAILLLLGFSPPLQNFCFFKRNAGNLQYIKIPIFYLFTQQMSLVFFVYSRSTFLWSVINNLQYLWLVWCSCKLAKNSYTNIALYIGIVSYFLCFLMCNGLNIECGDL